MVLHLAGEGIGGPGENIDLRAIGMPAKEGPHTGQLLDYRSQKNRWEQNHTAQHSRCQNQSHIGAAALAMLDFSGGSCGYLLPEIL